MELVSQAELAKRLKVSAPYIAKLKKKGVFKKCLNGKKIYYECALKSMEENIKDFKKTNPKQFKKEIQKTIPKEIPEFQANEMVGELELLLIDAENPSQKVAIIKDFWNGKLAQIKYEVEKKRYFLKEEIINQTQKIGVVIRQRLFNVPIKIAPLCYGKEITEIQELIYDAINEALEDLQRLENWK